jgi:protein phosphatase methylesterase 1
MDSSSNLNPLREDTSEEHLEPIEAPASVFAARPLRPPSTNSSEKYSPVEWKSYFDKEDDISITGSDDVFHVYMAGNEGPVVFCLHGGGYSGLSFSIVASKIKEKARVVAMDLRGHGKSVSENELELSLETMSNDVLAVIKELYGDSPPAIVLVGHSMGGSVAVQVAANKTLPSLAGLVVVDVVEVCFLIEKSHLVCTLVR